MNELAQLVDDLGRRSFDVRLGNRGFTESFDEAL
jgi:acyl-CoA dehydrogenase